MRYLKHPGGMRYLKHPGSMLLDLPFILYLLYVEYERSHNVIINNKILVHL